MKKITKIESVTTQQKKKLRVAAYCRVSTGSDEQLVSLEAQKTHYEEYITSNPEWEFAGIYYDEGITGTKKEKRPSLNRMIQDCEDGKIDFIVTKSLSRFARNTTDCLELVRRLLELHIPVYFEKENLNTGSMESELLLSVMSSLAESESVSISENNKWGVRCRFENGTFKIAYAPYGYSVKNGEFSIRDDEAVWVRFMFDKAVEGLSSYQIALLLAERNAPTRRNGKWTSAKVADMLKNEKYIGDCLFQKTYRDSYFKRHLNRGEKDQFYMEGHHEAIVSKEVFEAAGRAIELRKNEKRVKTVPNTLYPFTGKIICGECGALLVRHMNSTGSFKYPAWVCREHLHHKEKCSMRYVRESALKAAFATMMNKLIFGRKEVLQGLLDDIRKKNNKSDLKRIDEIDVALDEITLRRGNLSSIATKGYIDSVTFTQESNNLNLEAEQLKSERESLINGINDDLHKTETLQELIQFTGKQEMFSDFDEEVFKKFVARMTLASRKEVVFHLKCGLNLKEKVK